MADPKKYADITDILMNDALRGKLGAFVNESVNATLRRAGEAETLRHLRDEAAADLNIDPKLYNFIVSLHHNHSFAEKQAEVEQQSEALNAYAKGP